MLLVESRRDTGERRVTDRAGGVEADRAGGVRRVERVVHRTTEEVHGNAARDRGAGRTARGAPVSIDEARADRVLQPRHVEVALVALYGVRATEVIRDLPFPVLEHRYVIVGDPSVEARHDAERIDGLELLAGSELDHAPAVDRDVHAERVVDAVLGDD